MKRVLSLAALLLMAFAVTVGCGEKSTSKSTETIKGPGGTTEIEHKDTVKKSGENPPNP
jgi:ABC-type oligopeptide transport system substrate-binding subunit